MSTPLPITHDCCWEGSGHSACPMSNGFLAAIPRGVASLWRAFARRQARKLERRIAGLEPDFRWLP